MRCLWDDMPETARAATPPHVREHLRRAYYGRRAWVHAPGWVDFRDVRRLFASIVADGAKRTHAVAIVAEQFHISERWVWQIIRRSRVTEQTGHTVQ